MKPLAERVQDLVPVIGEIGEDRELLAIAAELERIAAEIRDAERTIGRRRVHAWADQLAARKDAP